MTLPSRMFHQDITEHNSLLCIPIDLPTYNIDPNITPIPPSTSPIKEDTTSAFHQRHFVFNSNSAISRFALIPTSASASTIRRLSEALPYTLTHQSSIINQRPLNIFLSVRDASAVDKIPHHITSPHRHQHTTSLVLSARNVSKNTAASALTILHARSEEHYCCARERFDRLHHNTSHHYCT